MHSISNVDERFSKDRSNTLYKMDDVVQLQCVGEVENVNSSPTKVNTFFVHTTFKLFFHEKMLLAWLSIFFFYQNEIVLPALF